MKILSVDSSAIIATVALADDDRLLAEYSVNNGNTHSETLLPMVENMLSAYGLSISDIDLFACSAGPGSFTGVRIGAATVKGLAFGRNKPCVCVSTLEAIAENLVAHKGLICPVMNARRSQVYTALFRSDGKELVRLMPDSALAIAELDEILAKYGEPVMFSGDGYGITLENLKKTEALHTPERLRYQSAFSVATVALREYRAGRYGTDSDIAVNYLRPSQAERERSERIAAENSQN